MANVSESVRSPLRMSPNSKAGSEQRASTRIAPTELRRVKVGALPPNNAMNLTLDRSRDFPRFCVHLMSNSLGVFEWRERSTTIFATIVSKQPR